MPLALGVAAIAIILAFVAWMTHRELLPMRRTLRYIRELPEHIGERLERK